MKAELELFVAGGTGILGRRVELSLQQGAQRGWSGT